MPYNSYERRPTYELLDELPYQGEWTEREYIALDTKKLVEFTNGFLEFLPAPTEVQQYVQRYVMQAVRAVIAIRGGGVLMHAPFKLKIDRNRYREPDILLLLDEDDPRRGNKYWTGADLVFEIVSPDNPNAITGRNGPITRTQQ